MTRNSQGFVLCFAAVAAIIGSIFYPYEVDDSQNDDDQRQLSRLKSALPGLASGTIANEASGAIMSLPAQKSNSKGRIPNFLLAGAQKAGKSLCTTA